LIALAWHFRADLRGHWDRLAPSAELADLAEQKLNRMAAENGPDRIHLTQAELQSLLDYRFGAFFPPYVTAPRVELNRGRVRLSARVATQQLPLSGMGEVMAILPDTTEVAAGGQLVPLDTEHVAFVVNDLSAARFPLPARLIPQLLERLGRTPAPGLPPDAIALPLPAGADAAYVHGDSLIFLRRAAAAAR
jgi:hypothetical protein